MGIALGLVLPALLKRLFPGQPFIPILMAFGLLVGIGYGFELYSKFTGHGHYDLMDAVATVAGGVLGMASLLLF